MTAVATLVLSACNSPAPSVATPPVRQPKAQPTTTPPVVAALPGDGRWFCQAWRGKELTGASVMGLGVAEGPKVAEETIVEIDGSRCKSMDDPKWRCGLTRSPTQLTLAQSYDPKAPFVPFPHEWQVKIEPRRLTGTMTIQKSSSAKAGKVFAMKPETLRATCMRVSPIDGVDHLEELHAATHYTFVVNPLQGFAEKGDAAAQYLFGRMLRDGQGLEKDAAKAKLWLDKAASQKHLKATEELSYLLERETPRDDAKLRALYELLAQSSDVQPSLRRDAAIAIAAQLLARDPSSQEARTWMKRAVETGDASMFEAVARYALLLIETKDAEKVKEAETLLRKHASTARLPAVYLGNLIANQVATGTPEEAASLYRKAMENGVDEGRVQLALALMDGFGVAKDEAAGLALLESASAGAESKFTLGVLAWTGKGIPKDGARGLKLIKAAANEGHSRALHWLGTGHEGRVFKDANPVRAQHYYELAAVDKPRRTGGWSYAPAVKARDLHAATLSAEDLAEAKRLAEVARVKLRF